MIRSATARLAAGTLALALPLAFAAGCGVEKKKTIKAEFAAAQSNLEKSKSVSVTLHLDDAQGNLAKLAGKHTPAALVSALLKGSITFTGDPAGSATFASLKPTSSPADLKASLTKVNFGILVRDDQAALGEIRLVAGVLYARVDLNEVNRLVKLGGGPDINSKLDQSLGQMSPQFSQALTDVRAGKWLKLPIAKYLDQLQSLAKSVNPALAGAEAGKSYDYKGLGGKLFTAVKPYVKITDANDSSSDRVLDVKVQARPAVKAVLAVLSADKSLPFGSFLGAVPQAKIDQNLADGTVHGTITLSNSHLKQVALDIESLRTLSPQPGKDSLAGVRLVVDVNDDAAQLTAPTDLASIDLGAIVDQFMSSMSSLAQRRLPSQSMQLGVVSGH